MGYDPNWSQPPYQPPAGQPPYGPTPQPAGQAPYGAPPSTYNAPQSAYGNTAYDQAPYDPTLQSSTQYPPPLNSSPQYPVPPPYGSPQYPAPPVPDYARPQPSNNRSRRTLWIVFGVIGGVVLLSCIGVLLFTGLIAGLVVGVTAGPRAAVDGYYKALEQQDYAKAYTYLDTSEGLTIQGQQFTKRLFIEAAMIVDRARGPVTDYTITNTNVNNDTATVTVDVTRRGVTTTQHLSVKKVGSAWKITPYQGSAQQQ